MPKPDPAAPCHNLPRALGEPLATLWLRVRLDDFAVSERLPFEPDGVGTHLWLYVEKRGWNTEAVARHLANTARVRLRDVGYSGLKDRWSVSQQWFSIPVSGQAPAWTAQSFEQDGLRILQLCRHGRKLRRGTHRANRFHLRLRGELAPWQAFNERFDVVRKYGVPNYFDAQRFGRGGGNVMAAQAMFDGARVDRRRRSLYLSAARAFLFNAVLATRVEQGSWMRILPGEAVNLDGSRSVFAAESPEALSERLLAHDIHPSGPLWGRGATLSQDEVLALEQSVMEQFPKLARGLERSGVAMMRRPLRIPVRELAWQCEQGVLRIVFTLPPGAYATAVLREIVNAVDVHRHPVNAGQVRNKT